MGKKTKSFFSILTLLVLISSTWSVGKAKADAGEDLTVDGVQTIIAGAHSYENVYVINGGVLKVDSSKQCLELNVAGEVFVDSSSYITANSMSSGPGDGETISTYAYTGGGGAGYGGSGGQGGGPYFASGGAAYGYANAGGDYTGSKGGNGRRGPSQAGQGGKGGGRIKIHASTINIEGSIQANGGGGYAKYGYGGGGGSGGGITLMADSVTINGSVTANGGSGGSYGGGGGAGGRITIIYGIREINENLITVYGGVGVGGCSGEDGTVQYTPVAFNQPPELNLIGNKTVDEGQPLIFAISSTDPDEDPLSLSAAGLPPGASFTDNGDNTGTFTWTPTYTQSGTYTSVHFEVTDGDLADSENITVTVSNVNRAPDLATIGSKSVNENTLLQFTISAIDPDLDTDPGAVLTYSASGLPVGATLHPATGEFSWTPTEIDDGTYTVTFTATDDGVPVLSDSEIITITVNEVNLAPIITVPSSPQNVIEGGNPAEDPPGYLPLTFTLTATDPDIPANTLSISSPNLPPGATLDPVTGDFEWLPDYNAYGNAPGRDGVYDVTFAVSDDGSPPLSDSCIVTIVVQNEPCGATQDIVAANGDRVTNDAGTAEVYIPPDALREDATVTIGPHSQYALQDESGQIIGLQYDFGPSGITFDKPVTITLYYDPAVIAEPWLLDIYYYNEVTGLWEPMGATLDEPNFCFYIEVHHFSSFALVEVPTPQQITDYIKGLSDDAFDKKPAQQKKALESKIDAVEKQIGVGAYEGAIHKLLNDIWAKMDGKGQDWIINPATQQALCTMIDALVGHLENLKTQI